LEIALRRQRRLAARLGLIDEPVSSPAASRDQGAPAGGAAGANLSIAATRLQAFAASPFPRRPRREARVAGA
jgi:hypothetical protein